MIGKHVNWKRFSELHDNAEVAFEQLCRILFRLSFFTGTPDICFHSNQNNPGIEIEPVLDSKSKKRISFQAKYFSSRVSYKQIKDSMMAAIRNYVGKIDRIYLYSNKDINSHSKDYAQTIEKLNNNGIELILITNQEILNNIIVNELTIIASLFFNNPSIQGDWIANRFNISKEQMGPRFNEQFNVETQVGEQLHLFCQTDDALQILNGRKKAAIAELAELRNHMSRKEYINKVISNIEALEDINHTAISACLDWKSKVEISVSTEMSFFQSEKEALAARINSNEGNSRDVYKEYRSYEMLEDILSNLYVDEHENGLIFNQTLIVSGDAGTGKSHALGHAAQMIIDQGKCAVLFLGHKFLSDESIETQMLRQLGLDYAADTFWETLEGIGIDAERKVVVFIDAINESVYKKIWKTGLSDLIAKLSKYPHIKLAISVRSAYRSSVLDDAVEKRIESGEICSIRHNGFSGNIEEAVTMFFDHYKIVFTPANFLRYEFENPLLLYMYCKTYSKNADNLCALFEEYVSDINEKVKDELQKDYNVNIVNELVMDIIGYFLSNEKRSIPIENVLKLDYWETYGLTSMKLDVISSMQRHDLIMGMSTEGKEEVFFFSFERLYEFFAAKYIMRRYGKTKNEFLDYVTKYLLKIENGEVVSRQNVEIFTFLCAMYAEQFNEECVEDVLCNADADNFDAMDIRDKYISSFAWRKPSTINAAAWVEYVGHNSYVSTIQTMFRVLIDCSARADHPLNASCLHEVLFAQDMPIRDQIWTTYINHADQSNHRMRYLIDLLRQADVNPKMQLQREDKKLLCILLCWLFTSSNRFLRDKSTGAVIELLRSDFSLAPELFDMFGDVNDPYVIQRLCAAILGACVKSQEVSDEDFQKLVRKIYVQCFDQVCMPADILTRDYAREIIEYYFENHPDKKPEDLSLSIDQIRPPYGTPPIPKVKYEEYDDNTSESGLYDNFHMIVRSMAPNIQHYGYGDFGRYVFQARLSSFEGVDMENLYHFAVQYIRDVLQYKDELFEFYQPSMRAYSRHDTKKTERIGKKYQWIALHHILARLADNHLVQSRNDFNTYVAYEGAWCLDIRDFDPTISCDFLQNDDIPCFPEDSNLVVWSDERNITLSDAERWVGETGAFFEKHIMKLKKIDTCGNEWIALEEHSQAYSIEDYYSNREQRVGAQDIWSMSYSCLIKASEFDVIKEGAISASIDERNYAEAFDLDQIYNREYPWAQSARWAIPNYWNEVNIVVGKKEEYITMKKFDYDPERAELISEDEDVLINTPVKQTIGYVMPTCCDYSWNSQYDASREDGITFQVPTKDIIDKLALKQTKTDGYFYSGNDLVAFDISLISKERRGLLMRKSYLEKYLDESNMRLLWTCTGEKRKWIGPQHQVWAEWRGIYTYENHELCGKMLCERIQNSNH